MKNAFLILFLIVVLTSCDNKKLSHKKTVNRYYKAFDSGDFNKLKRVIHDSITIVSGDFITPFDKDSFYEFYKWDSIFEPSYEVIDLTEENDNVIATISQKNIRNEFLKNNPLKLNVKVSFASGKITKLEELDYIGVNWQEWNQEKDSLVNWIKVNHPNLDGFVNDMTRKGAINYVRAIELYEGRE
ncbi:hypothetical protein SAMN04488007_1091 [Maribacter aquivivus]|uniref:SnoaL-like domain-containing protein n=1 Tax=Maribacter aquivivus TaxID=228958 RepID=A0A1M6LAN4_9FLAO|nr:nuclear transport factor 2 family protein [Maribacter aquivivus]SHJ68266.1 hypothetical protein SAMN04488007_1091 [Maribacter aquivivus]